MKLKPVILLMTIPILVAIPGIIGWRNASGATSSDRVESNAAAVNLDQATTVRLQKLVPAILDFRQMSLFDYRKALQQYATPETIKHFDTIDKKIWGMRPAKDGWSYFMTVSAYVFGGIKGDKPIVGFYNPWVDLFLITAWEVHDDTVRMIDAELLTGDLLREGKTINTVPHWLRINQFKPAALGLSVAASIQSFEKHFPVEPISDWRKKPRALSRKLARKNIDYSTAAQMLVDNFSVVLRFHCALKDENPRITSARSRMKEFVKKASAGQIEQLIKAAAGTMAEQRKVLEQLPPSWYKELNVVSAVVSDRATLVFLAPTYSPGACLSLLLKGEPQTQKIVRIDFVYYQGIYEYVQGQRSGISTKS